MDDAGRKAADLEQRVAELEAQLDAARREIDAFTYAVSHDLRAPLRSISGYCQVLQEDLGPTLDPQYQHFLNRTQESALKLGRQIDALMSLSRVARTEVQPSEVDVSALISRIAHEQLSERQGRAPTIDIEPGIRVIADAKLISRVFEQLLANAIKFSAEAAAPQIDVTQERHGTRLVVRVRDNGVGFDMRYAEKLFVPFQRLHPEADFPGLGMGLALVQKMLALIGGRVWAESAPGQGTTIYVDVPAA